MSRPFSDGDGPCIGLVVGLIVFILIAITVFMSPRLKTSVGGPVIEQGLDNAMNKHELVMYSILNGYARRSK